MLGIEVVDDDEVEIRRRRHLAPAELAEREDRGLLPRDAAVQAGEVLADRAVQRADERVGEPGEGLARPAPPIPCPTGCARRSGTSAPARTCGCGRGSPRRTAAWRSERASSAASSAFLRQRAEEARLDQRVHGLGILRQDVGKPRRGAEHERDQRDQVGILPQQREQPRAAVQPGEEPIEGDDARHPDSPRGRSGGAARARARRTGCARTRRAANGRLPVSQRRTWPTLRAAGGSPCR